MVLTAYIVLSPATNSSCHRHRRIKGFAEPGWANKNLRRLDTSNGCQDHTVLPSALAPFVCAPQIAHEVQPALRLPMRARRCRVHRIPPRARDDRDTPLSWGETARLIEVFLPSGETNYFCKQDWTARIRLIPFNKFAPPRGSKNEPTQALRVSASDRRPDFRKSCRSVRYR
jgi:hypothetical protein